MADPSPGALGGGPFRSRRGPLIAVLGMVLMATGAGAFLVAGNVGTDFVEIHSPVAPVNIGAREPGDIRANNSPSISANPRDIRQLALTNRVDSPMFACRLHTSADKGDTWTEVRIPHPEGEEPKCFAPDVAFGADGTLHVSFVTLAGSGNSPNALWTSASRDGGRTLTTPVRVSGRYAFGARLAADPGDPNRLYLVWLQAREIGLLSFEGTGHPIVASRSDDGGRTWGLPVPVNPSQRLRVLGAATVARPDGVLLVSYIDVGNDSLDFHGAHRGDGGPAYSGEWKLVLARSTDGGLSFSDVEVEAHLVPSARFVAFFPPVPSLAASTDGRDVFAAYTDSGAGDADVKLWASHDGGARFGPGRRVNDTPVGDGRTQNLAAVAVAPDGRVDVVYNDRRADPNDARTEVSMQWSNDGGATFSPSTRVSQGSFDSQIGFGVERGLPELGSRSALWSTDERTVAVWADTRAGNQASIKQDLGRVIVGPRRPSLTEAEASSVQGAAIVIALVGVIVLVSAATKPVTVAKNAPIAVAERAPGTAS